MSILALRDGYADLQSGAVLRDGRSQRLTPTEVQLLQFLLDREGGIVSRGEVLKSVWGYSEKVKSRTLDTYIWRLRRKLEVDSRNPELLVTVAGKGIQLIELPRPAASEAGDAALLAVGLEGGMALWRDAPEQTAAAWQELQGELAGSALARQMRIERRDEGTLILRAPDVAAALAWAAAQLDTERVGLGERLRCGLERVEWQKGGEEPALAVGCARVLRLAEAAAGGQLLASKRVAGALGKGQLAKVGSLVIEAGAGWEPLFGRASGPAAPLVTPTASFQPLPPLPPRFVGRDGLVARVEQSIAAGQRRFVLYGPPGVGKTSLLVALAERLRPRFEGRGGLVHCQMGGKGDAIALLAGVLGVLTDKGDRVEAVERALRARGACLVVLDGLAADAQLAPLAARLPESLFLTAAGEPLELADFELVVVPQLDPAAAALLFLDRVRALPAYDELNPRDALVVALVEEVGGTPLALELAARRGRLLRPAQLLDRLRRDGPPQPRGRKKKIGAAVAFSWGLLAGGARQALSRLAVTDAPLPLSAAEWLLSDLSEEPEVLLEELADAGLVVAEDEAELDELRLRISGPVRAHARGRLEPAELARLRVHLARWFAERAAGWGRALGWGPRQTDALARLRLALPHLENALRELAGSVAQGGVEQARDHSALIDLLLALYWVRECIGRPLVGELLSVADAVAARPSARGAWLVGALWALAGRFDEAESALEQAWSLAAPDEPTRPEMVAELAVCRFIRGDVEGARSLVEGLLAELPSGRLSPSAVRAATGLTIVLAQFGLNEESEALLDRAIESAASGRAALYEAQHRLRRGLVQGAVGRLSENGLLLMAGEMRRLEEMGAQTAALMSSTPLSRLQLVLQGPAAALRSLRYVRDRMERQWLDSSIAWQDLVWSWAAQEQGDYAEARRRLEGVLAGARAERVAASVRRVAVRLAAVELEAGCWQASLAAIEEARAAAGPDLYRFYLFCFEAGALLGAGRRAEAEAALEAARAWEEPGLFHHILTVVGAWFSAEDESQLLSQARAWPRYRSSTEGGFVLRSCVRVLARAVDARQEG